MLELFGRIQRLVGSIANALQGKLTPQNSRWEFKMVLGTPFAAVATDFVVLAGMIFLAVL
jgi:hypothetical protein